MTRLGRAPLAITVGFLSAGTLAYEILLVRVFSIAQFHHFAYLAVGVAMLGFGASGVAMSLRPNAAGPPRVGHLAGAATATAFALVLSPAIALRLPIDAASLPWSPGQWWLLAALEIVLALPFGAAGLAILLALALAEEKPGGVYASSFIGSGCGAAASLLMMSLMLPDRALAVPGVIAAAGAVSAMAPAGKRSAARYGGWIAVAVTLAAVVSPFWRIEVSPYKGLPQVLAFPGAHRISEAASPVGWLVEAEAPAFRYAPGLSLSFRGDFPPQRALFVDGQLAGAVAGAGSAPALDSLVEELPTALPYALGGRSRVLVIGAGDGMEVVSALAHGAREVAAAELHPVLARRVAGQLDPERAARVRWWIGDARSFLARNRDRFDLITIGVGGAFGAAAGGIHSLDEDFLHTSEAYDLYLDRLSSRGVLAVTRWLDGPPRDPVRALLTATRALRRSRAEAAGRGLFVARSWATVTVILKPSGLSGAEVARLRGWALDHGLDVDWYPGIREAPRAEFNVVEDPVLYRAAEAGMAGPGAADEFAARYPFLVEPVSDARPYPRHFIGAQAAPLLLRGDRAALLPFAEWGVVALLATLVASVAAAALLLLVPLAAMRGGGSAGGRLTSLSYFAAIGFGYLAVEIAFIQVLGLLLGHPVYAVAAVLAVMLVFSGVGSNLSDRLAWKHGVAPSIGLALLLAIEASLLLAVVHATQGAPIALRVVVALLALAPPALLMGVPFPIGLRITTGGVPSRLAGAWAANGFASVVAAPLSALIALEWGSRALLLCAAAGYACAASLLAAATRSIARPGASAARASPSTGGAPGTGNRRTGP